MKEIYVLIFTMIAILGYLYYEAFYKNKQK